MIDLHMHSNLSLDGEFTPRELIDQCVEKALKIISITDHNHAGAYTDAKEYAAFKGIQLIPGIEIDCLYGDTPLHLLAYGLSPDIPAVKTLCDAQYQLEVNASKNRVLAAQRLGFDITLADFDYLNNTVITPEDIAEVLLHHKNYPRHPLLLPYRKGGIRADNPLVNFYWDYYSKGKPCYEQLSYPTLDEVINMIHLNDGIAVLAHPGITFRENFDLIEEIIQQGLDGLEVFSSYHYPLETRTLFELAKSKDLLMTAGSDYHGKIKPSVQLGVIDYHGLYEKFIHQYNVRKPY